MRYIELKFGKRLEELLMTSDTIYQLEKKLGIDATTVSKWRKLLNEVFWKNFKRVRRCDKHGQDLC